VLNPTKTAEIVQSWKAIHDLCARGDRGYSIPAAGYFHVSYPAAYYNLPFVLAYAVLDDVLSEMIEDGIFTCPGNRPLLGRKMRKSCKTLAWQDYLLVERGRFARNDLAHEAKLASKDDCLKYIAAVGAELKAWKII
jgi:hypothetical protein